MEILVSLDLRNKEFETMTPLKPRTEVSVLAIRIFPPEKIKGKYEVRRLYECSREAKKLGLTKIKEVPALTVQRKRREKTGEVEVDIALRLGLGRFPRLIFSKAEYVEKSRRWGVWGHIPLSPQQAKKLGSALLEHAKPSEKEVSK